MTSGINWCDIDGMTINDINMAAQVRQEQNKELTQTLAWIIYNGAALTGIAVNDPHKFPKLGDAFPSLFERNEQQDWRVMKQRMEDYTQFKRTNGS